MNSPQKCWPSLIIESYHNWCFRQAIVVILLLFASVSKGTTFSQSAKEFVNFQENTLKWRVHMLLTNCKKDYLKDLRRTLCIWSSHANTFRKLVFQKSYFYSNIMTKILQPQKISKQKNKRRAGVCAVAAFSQNYYKYRSKQWLKYDSQITERKKKGEIKNWSDVKKYKLLYTCILENKTSARQSKYNCEETAIYKEKKKQ